MESPWQYNEQAGPPPGNRIVVNIDRPDPALVERFKKAHLQVLLSVGQISHLGIMDRAILPLAGRDWSICGPAVTVKLDHIDVLMSGAATKVCQPGDVIVIAAGGHMEGGVWGGALSRSAKRRGCVGIVIDGVVAGTDTLLDVDLPVFCRGVYPLVGTFDKPGSVNVPVSCGGVIINPGDLVVGNKDGLAVIPRNNLDRIVAPVEDRLEVRAKSFADEQENQTDFFDVYDGTKLVSQAGVVWEE